MHFTLCDLLSDITQNAIEAASSVITVTMLISNTDLQVKISDNGKGMSPEQLERAKDPFYTDGVKHPKRKIGLGIPFLIQTAESTGGYWDIQSKVKDSSNMESGTVVSVNFDLANIDTPPLGDVSAYIRHVLTFDAHYELLVSGSFYGSSFEVRRSELLEVLGLKEQGSFTDAAALNLVKLYVDGLLEDNNG